MTHINAVAMSHADVAAGLKTAMRRMPGSVALVTTHDPLANAPAGMAASTVISVSLEPPSMLVAVNRTASVHASIERARRFCLNLMGTTQTALVGLFAKSELREARFASDDWAFADQIPYLPAACANIFCDVKQTMVHGSHELFVGDVYDIRTQAGDSEPLGWFEGTFARVSKLD